MNVFLEMIVCGFVSNNNKRPIEMSPELPLSRCRLQGSRTVSPRLRPLHLYCFALCLVIVGTIPHNTIAADNGGGDDMGLFKRLSSYWK